MFGRSRAVLKKILNDIKKLLKVSDIVMQIILLLLCCYNVYNSIIKETKIKLIIYICLLVISIFYIIFIINFYKKNIDKEVKKKTSKIVKIFRLSYRSILVTFNLVDVFTTDMTGLPLLLALFSAISYLLTIIITIISNVLTNYIELMTIAFEEDAKPISNTIESLKHPLYGIAQSLTKDKQEEVIDEKRQEKLDIINELNEQRKIEVQEKQDARKIFRKEVIRSLFRRKKKIAEIEEK